MDSILSHFPEGFEPTELQVWVLLEVERLWDAHDIIIIDAAVAAGKSHMAMTILSWNGSGNYAVPSNILLDQIEDHMI